MCDLGHEHSGLYARRLVERERMAAGKRQLSWRHGAATMGLLPSALKTQRTELPRHVSVGHHSPTSSPDGLLREVLLVASIPVVMLDVITPCLPLVLVLWKRNKPI